jgi:hypothetical protein
MLFKTLASLTFAIAVFGASTVEAACFDVSKNQPTSLSGHLTYRIFAGSPNFRDVQKGDEPEPSYVLKLDKKICLTGDEFANPSNMFDEVQLMADKDLESKLVRFRDTDVIVKLRDQGAGYTAHHHRPLLATVTAISARR